MQATMVRGAAHNPFCSERVRPGSIPYLLPAEQKLDDLLQSLASTGFAGQIVGPHGTGKSTLLHSLAAELARQGHRVIMEEAGRCQAARARPGQIILLDSAERIPRLMLQNRVRGIIRSGGGLVLTTHSDLGLPTILQTNVSSSTAHRIVRRLLDGWAVDPPAESEVDILVKRHNGNLRLALFDLYDWYETQMVSAANSHKTQKR